jgi:glutathione S-transferase
LKDIIVVYGVPLSPNTQRVLAVLAEKGLKYELKRIKVMESEHKVIVTLNKNMG